MLYLTIALLVMIFGIALVLLRHRRPSSMGHSIGTFEKEMRALAPEEGDYGA